jgi:hypothetical protein
MHHTIDPQLFKMNRIYYLMHPSIRGDTPFKSSIIFPRRGVLVTLSLVVIHTFISLSRTALEWHILLSLGEVSRYRYLWLLIHTFNLSRTAFECPSHKTLGEVSRLHYHWLLFIRLFL